MSVCLKALAGLSILLVPVPAIPRTHPAKPPVASCRDPGPEPALPKGAPPNSTYLTSVAPPIRFRGNVSNININFVSQAEADRICAGGVKVCGRVFYACAEGKRLTMPNPCAYSMVDDYARLLCHELAHVNGWPASHGD